MPNYDLDTLEGLDATIYRLQHADISEETEKLALKCIQKAQFFKDVDLEFRARYAYIRVVTFLNKNNLAIAMFPWLLKKCDEDRERYDYQITLWAYKWIVNNVRNFAKVPLDKVESLLADFEQRYKDYGTGNKVIYYIKLQYFDAIGEPEKAAKEYKRYLKARTNHRMDDCRACQPNNMIDHLVGQQQYEEALKMAKPIIDGSLSCLKVPSITYPKLIIPAMLLGKWEDADNYATLARQKLKLHQSHLAEASHLVTYYALKEDFTKGRNVVEKQLPHSLGNVSEVEKFYFYLSATHLFSKMKEKGKKQVKLNLPPSLSWRTETNTYSIDQFLSFFDGQLATVSRELDQRNGNTYYTNLIAKNLAEIKTIEDALKGR